MPNIEEIDLLLKFGGGAGLDAILTRLHELKTVRDELASKQLIPMVEASTLKAIETIGAQIKQLNDLLAKTNDIEALAKIQKDAENLSKAEAALIKTTNQFADAMERENALLIETAIKLEKNKQVRAELGKQVSDLVKLNQSENEATKQLQEKLLKLEAEYKKLSKTKKTLTDAGVNEKAVEKALNEERNAGIKIQSLKIKEDRAAAGSIDQLSLRLTRLRSEYKALSEAQRKSSDGSARLKEIESLDKGLKELDASTGVFNRNVGDYANQLGGLFSKIPGGDKVNDIIGKVKGLSAGAAELGIISEAAAAGIASIGASASVILAPLALAGIAFLRTTEGAEKLTIVTEKAKGALFGFLSAFNPNSNNFLDFVAAIQKGINGGGVYAETLNRVTKQMIPLITEQGRLNAAIAIGAQAASEGNTNFEDRAKAVRELAKNTGELNKVQLRQAELEEVLAAAELFKEKSGGGDTRAASLALEQASAKVALERANGLVQERQLQQQILAIEIERADIEGDELVAAAEGRARIAALRAQDESRSFEQRKASLLLAQKERQVSIQDAIQDAQAAVDAIKRFNDGNLKSVAGTQALIKLENAKAAAIEEQIKNKEELIDLITKQFRLESTILKDVASERKAEIVADLADTKASFGKKEQALKDFQALNEKSLAEQTAVARRTLGTIEGITKEQVSRIDFSKLINSKDLAKDIGAITTNTKAFNVLKEVVLELRGGYKELRTEADKLNDAFNKQVQLIEKSLIELSIANITAFKAEQQSAADFVEQRVELERQKNLALEKLQHERNNAALKLEYDLLKDSERLNGVDGAKVLAELYAKQLQENIRNKDAIRKIDIAAALGGRQIIEDNIEFEANKKRLAAIETIASQKDLNKELQKIDRETIEERIKGIQETLDKLSETAPEFQKLQNELLLLQIELAKQTKSKFDQTIDDSNKSVQLFLGSLQDALNRAANSADARASKAAENVARQEQRAALGLQNTLAETDKVQQEAEAKAEKLRRTAEKAAKVQAFFNLLAAYAKDNPDTAAAKALVQISLTDFIAERLEHGTEGTMDSHMHRKGIDGNGRIDGKGITKGRSHKNGGFIVEMEGNEGVFGSKTMRNLGESNFLDLKDLAKNGPLEAGFFRRQYEPLDAAIIETRAVVMPQTELVNEIKSVKQAIDNKPVQQINVNEFQELVESWIKKGLKHNIVHPKPRFGK